MGRLVTVPWGKAAGLGTAWAAAAASVLLWWWTHPTWGSPVLLFLMLPLCFVLIISGVVHHSARVGKKPGHPPFCSWEFRSLIERY